MSIKKNAEKTPREAVERMRERVRRELGPSTPSSAPRVYNRLRAGVPDGAVYIGRPGPWGNPFALPKKHGEADRIECLGKYREWLAAEEQAEFRARVRTELRGKDLVCWCAPKLCHGDVLLQMASEDLLLQDAVERWKNAKGVFRAVFVEALYGELRHRLPDASTGPGLLTSMLPTMLVTLVPKAKRTDLALVLVDDDDLHTYAVDEVPEGARHVVMPWELYRKICERGTMEAMAAKVGEQMRSEDPK